MPKNSEKEFYRALKGRAYDCSFNEFKALLQEFGDNKKAVNVLQSVVRESIKVCQDCDFYCGSELEVLGKQQKALDDFYLMRHKSLKRDFDASGRPEDSKQELYEEIAVLKERVKKLENKRMKTPRLGG